MNTKHKLQLTLEQTVINHKEAAKLDPTLNDIINCEDIHCGKVQQCHEPAGNSPSTKSTQRRSTRPLRKVSFNQSGPTTIRPDLNNFSA